MNPKISIIIPVYNGERFIAKCVESILMQTMRELQMIVVDDGSTDHTYEILKKYAANDARIEIVRQKNRGVAQARNRGLEDVKGEWVVFIDSDDIVQENYCEMLLNEANKLNVDVMITYAGEEEEKNSILLNDNKELILGCLAFDETMFNFNVDAPWGKIFRTSIIKDNKICFPVQLTRSEDALFCASFYYKAKKIGVLNRFGYIHNEREGSLCRSFSSRNKEMLEMILTENQKWLRERYLTDEDYMHASWYRVLPGIVECEKTYFLHKENKKIVFAKAIEYQRFLNRKQIRKAIKNLKLVKIHNRQFFVRLCFYKCFLGWLFMLLKRR